MRSRPAGRWSPAPRAAPGGRLARRPGRGYLARAICTAPTDVGAPGHIVIDSEVKA